MASTDVETLKELNKTKVYNTNEIVDIIPCNQNELDYITDNGGWTIKCNGKDEFIVEGSGCSFKSGSKDFNYTGNIQQFIIPKVFKDKNITIELWGAQGGGSIGGKGGYSKIVSQLGNKFEKGVILYFVIGGQPRDVESGYNGGGVADSRGNYRAYGGGGATHIAIKSGLLSSLENNKTSIIMVAGGGGGGTWALTQNGGYGGGANMNGGDGTSVSGFGGGGGTLTSGGLPSVEGFDNYGSFGIGGYGMWAPETSNFYNSGAGGGGYYGGAGGSWANNTDKNRAGSGGGGSGYCDTSIGTCSGSNASNSGNGKAKISW